MTTTVTRSVELTEQQACELAELLSDQNETEMALLRRWITEGMRRYRLERAIGAYRVDEVGLSEAAALAGVPIGAFLDELADRRVAVLTDPAIMKDELNEAIVEFGLPRELSL